MTITPRTIIAIFCAVLGLAGNAGAQMYTANLQTAQVVPPVASASSGYARLLLNESSGALTYTIVFSNVSGVQTAAHLHGAAAVGVNGPTVISFGAIGGSSGGLTGTTTITPTQIAQLRSGVLYLDVHSTDFPAGEIRGQLNVTREVDFDGDGRSDLSVMRFPNVAPPGVAQVNFHTLNSTAGYQITQWGDANIDFPRTVDFDGDGKSDVAVYRNGASPGAPSYFYILRSSDSVVQIVQWGVRGDQAVCRDFDGDGKADVAIYREGATQGSPATWWILRSADSGVTFTDWGATGDGISIRDVPEPQDYDGDGKTDLAIYRAGSPTANSYYVKRSSDGNVQYQAWGDFNSDYVIPGDFDGDGKGDFAVARTGAAATTPIKWWILQSSNGQIQPVATYGVSSDLPTPGDYDGDGKTDISVFRRGLTTGSQSSFYSIGSFDGTSHFTRWGVREDFPVATFDVQ